MKVRVLIEQVVEANVSMEDFEKELRALKGPESDRQVLSLLNTCLLLLRSISPDQVRAMAPYSTIIHKSLHDEAARYLVPSAATPDVG